MAMRLLTYRLGRQHQQVVDRVDLVMDEAARLVGQSERRGLGTVEIAVTTAQGMADLICAAHERLVGASDWDTWFDRRRAGFATPDRSGCSLIINAEVLGRDRVEIDKTVLHELKHAFQFNRPGAWESARKGIAFDYGIGDLSDGELRTFDRRIARDEREAEAVERLHRQLAKAVA
jgi:hypothetical protein